jgi:sulfide:quinone oxidoreductase
MCEREGLKSVTVIEPSPIHYYQPLWTLVGGGVKSNAASARPMEDVIPKSAQWIQAAATAFDPDNNRVVLEGGRELEYDYLVVAAGIRSDWDAVPGVREGLDRPESGVVSVYDYSYSAKVWSEYNRIKDWDRKTLVFTMPPTPIKCAGAPQKIMWLLEDRLRRANQRDTASVEFWVPGPAMFSVPYYSAKLEKLREERGVAARFRHELVSLDVDRRVATFRDLGGGGGGSRLVEKRYDLIHVVPHMGPPDAIKNSPLAEASPPGYMDVDPATLRSARYRNVFGLGDCTNTPNSKTAAAVTRQAPVVVHNLGRVIRGLEPDGAYDGYASCPPRHRDRPVPAGRVRVRGQNHGDVRAADRAVPPQPRGDRRAPPAAVLLLSEGEGVPVRVLEPVDEGVLVRDPGTLPPERGPQPRPQGRRQGRGEIGLAPKV